MRYAKLMKNDTVDTDSGIAVSIWLQGCPFRCEGCHNPETWDFNGGIEIDDNELINMTLDAISENGIKRNLSILGGEPLAEPNLIFVKRLIHEAKQRYPDIKIYLWTGYTYDYLRYISPKHAYILYNVDVLITGPFILSQRNIRLPLKGSENQEVWRRNSITGRLVLDKI